MPKNIRTVVIPGANYQENFTIELPKDAEIFKIGEFGENRNAGLYMLVEAGTTKTETRTFRAEYLSSRTGDFTGEARTMPDKQYRYIGDMDPTHMLFEVLD